MEFHELGKYCSVAVCKLLDFLPFHCSYCGCVFCKEHFPPSCHNCSGESQSSNDTGTGGIEPYYVCSEDTCTVSDAVPLCCVICHKHYCISHRHHGCLDKAPSEDEIKRWNQPQEQFKVAKNEVDSLVSSKLQEQIRKKGNSTAQKLQLMKLKGHAKGAKDIPTPHRVYFLVYSPLRCASHGFAIYVNNEWTLGRVIDSVAELCKVPNRNNEANAAKLRIFQHSNGMVLAPLTKIFQSFIDEEIIQNGDKLILEYTPSENVICDRLIDISLYKE